MSDAAPEGSPSTPERSKWAKDRPEWTAALCNYVEKQCACLSAVPGVGPSIGRALKQWISEGVFPAFSDDDVANSVKSICEEFVVSSAQTMWNESPAEIIAKAPGDPAAAHANPQSEPALKDGLAYMAGKTAAHAAAVREGGAGEGGGGGVLGGGGGMTDFKKKNFSMSASALVFLLGV